MNPEQNELPPEEPSDGKETKVHAEEAKDRQTSHWDLDYLPADEVKAAYEEGAEDQDDQSSE